jgi:hypothetical protein
MTDQMLIARAKEAQKYAYAPYSNFAVGAALLCPRARCTWGATWNRPPSAPALRRAGGPGRRRRGGGEGIFGHRGDRKHRRLLHPLRHLPPGLV